MLLVGTAYLLFAVPIYFLRGDFMALSLLLSWFSNFFSSFFSLEVVIYAVMALFTVSLFNFSLRFVKGGRVI